LAFGTDVGMLSKKQSTVMSAIAELGETNTRLHANTMGELEKLQSQLVVCLEKTKPLDELDAKLSKFAEEGRSVVKQQKILASLQFKRITVRYDAIKKEHTETFEWIYTPSRVKFVDWLRNGNGVFWVQGKAGSGKSTLMKFLHNDPRTRRALEYWAIPNRPFIASHFFWVSGNEMQRSQKGLIQTLLYQVFTQYPSLIPNTMQERWDRLDHGTEYTSPWSSDELFQALDKLANQTVLRAKFCFFIDGLDEYSGDHVALVRLLKRLSSSPSIKICASSRPWNAFTNGFAGNDQQLKLEDLTREDIRAYVRAKFGGSSRFAMLQREDTRVIEIVKEIVRRACGVFLWVHLVVQSLLRGLEEGDDILDMRNRLDALPDDLEEYFKRMVTSIDPIYREQSARIFQAAIRAAEPLPLLAFSFLEKEILNPNYALDAKLRPLSDEEIRVQEKRMKKRLNARCKDLLEVNSCSSEHSFLKLRVDFLHRTVRDFFLSTNVLDEILSYQTLRNYDAGVSLCRILVALTKALPRDSYASWGRTWATSLACQLMLQAQEPKERSASQPMATQDISEQLLLLDEVESVSREQAQGELSIGMGRGIEQHADSDLRPKLRRIVRDYAGLEQCDGLDRVVKAEKSKLIFSLLREHCVQALRHMKPGCRRRRISGLSLWYALRDPADLGIRRLLGEVKYRLGKFCRCSECMSSICHLHSAATAFASYQGLLGASAETRRELAKTRNTVLRLAIWTGLVPHVRRALEKHPRIFQEETNRPYLHYALHLDVSDPGWPALQDPVHNIDMIRFLLEDGHRKGRPVESRVWVDFLQEVSAGKFRRSEGVLYDVFEMLLSHGANPFASFSDGVKIVELEDIVRKCFTANEARRLIELGEENQPKKVRAVAGCRRFFKSVVVGYETVVLKPFDRCYSAYCTMMAQIRPLEPVQSWWHLPWYWHLYNMAVQALIPVFVLAIFLVYTTWYLAMALMYISR
jgi:hypothetical protein